jgi:hypothetical protein
MATPVTFDLFSRIWAGGFDEHQKVFTPTAGQSMFGRTDNGSYTMFSPNSNALDIEIIRANLRIAPLMPRGGVGVFTGSSTAGAAATQHNDLQFNQGTTFSRKYPLLEETSNLGADQLLYRLIAYEGPYGDLTMEDRTRILGRRAYTELIRRCIRTFEYLAWQSLTLGKQSANAIGTPTSSDYDWRRNAANTITPTHQWGSALSTPLSDIDTGCDQMNFAGKVMPEFAIFGGQVMQQFQTNPSVTTAYANKLYFELLRFELDERPDQKFQRFVNAGLIPYGRIKTPKGYELTVFTYPHMYDSTSSNGTQTATKYFPDNYVLLGSTMTRADRYFGPPERLNLTAMEMQMVMERFGFNPSVPLTPPNVMGEGTTVLPQMFYTDYYQSNDRKHGTMRVQAAPVFPTTQTDGWVTILAGGAS